jgi:hypothetical protein
MIVRKADEVDPWTAEKAMANYYRPNSVVWYQKDEKSQGWVYRAKSDYVKSRTPPDEDNKWVRDYSFYLPWKQSNKYEIGMRVYFFNGQRLYGYIASKRYFGGTGEPNSEVDDDGVRTWEIDFSYNTYYFYESLPTEFLFPVKKRNGYIDGKINSFLHTDPEERPTTFEIRLDNGIYYNPFEGIINHLTEEGILSKDYKEYNSKYQSYAYDSETYVFYQQKLDAENKPIHRKSGLHRAKFLKELNPNIPAFTYAESQFRWTFGSYQDNLYFRNYFNPHGFSIEMWPNASENDYEFIPSYGFKTFGIFSLGNFGSGSFTLPTVSGQIGFPDYYNYYGWGWGTSMNGDMRGPDHEGNNYNETPDEANIFHAFFSRNCPAFDGRTMTINLLKQDWALQWEEEFFYCRDQETDVVYQCGSFWVLKNVDKSDYPKVPFSYVEEIIDSNESSYKWDNIEGRHSAVRKKDENPINLNKYKRRLTNTFIGWIGSRWE